MYNDMPPKMIRKPVRKVRRTKLLSGLERTYCKCTARAYHHVFGPCTCHWICTGSSGYSFSTGCCLCISTSALSQMIWLPSLWMYLSNHRRQIITHHIQSVFSDLRKPFILELRGRYAQQPCKNSLTRKGPCIDVRGIVNERQQSTDEQQKLIKMCALEQNTCFLNKTKTGSRLEFTLQAAVRTWGIPASNPGWMWMCLWSMWKEETLVHVRSTTLEIGAYLGRPASEFHFFQCLCVQSTRNSHQKAREQEVQQSAHCRRVEKREELKTAWV